MDSGNTHELIRKRGAPIGNKRAEKWTEEKALKLGQELLEWIQEEPEFDYLGKNETPHLTKANLFVGYFLASRGFDDDLVSYLSKKYVLFSELIQKAKYIQQYKICELATLGMLNTAMSIFMLKNNHGYKDRIDTDLTTNGKEINMPIINVLPYQNVDTYRKKIDDPQKKLNEPS